MKIICAPDSFKESISAVSAAGAIAAGVRDVAPHAEIDCCPVGDGGEGTLDALLSNLPGTRRWQTASDLYGHPRDAETVRFETVGLSYIESAETIGLALYPPAKRRILEASTFGVGELLMSALSGDTPEIVVGVGGSGTNDGGCGMAQAIGVHFIDRQGKRMQRRIGGQDLQDVAEIDISERCSAVSDRSILVATDVVNPFTGNDGATRVYAAQKGADADSIRRLEDGMLHLQEIIKRDLDRDLASLARSGAAGGLAGGLAAFAGAQLISGIDLFLDVTEFDRRVRGADLCFTGEGRLDAQSRSGKACFGVARRAAYHDVPVIALAGQIADRFPLSDHPFAATVCIGGDLPDTESMARAAELLRAAACSVVADHLKPQN